MALHPEAVSTANPALWNAYPQSRDRMLSLTDDDRPLRDYWSAAYDAAVAGEPMPEGPAPPDAPAVDDEAENPETPSDDGSIWSDFDVTEILPLLACKAADMVREVGSVAKDMLVEAVEFWSGLFADDSEAEQKQAEAQQQAAAQALAEAQQRRQQLQDTIDDVVDDPDVQAGHPSATGNTNTTWCNRAANRILTAIGYDTDPILDDNPQREGENPDIGWTSANDMAQNAADAAEDPDSGVTEVTEEEARAAANRGVPVLVAADNSPGHGHVAVVAPSDGDTTRVGQAGATNGTMDLDDGFGGLADDVHYYTLPEGDED